MNYYFVFVVVILILFLIICYLKYKNIKNHQYFMQKYYKYDIKDKENTYDRFNNYKLKNFKKDNYYYNAVTDINDNKVYKNKNNNYNKIKNINSLKKCQVPTLNTEQCYKSKEYECPIVNGTYLQCTNNYIPKPEQYNADCSNRTFDMVPYPWKISNNCFYDKINFNREKKYEKVKFV